MRSPSLLRPHGFTLLEVLVSLLLLSLLSLISWRALDGVERGAERLDAVVDESRTIMRVLGQMSEDVIRHADRDVLPEPPPTQADDPNRSAVLPAGIQVLQSDTGRTVLSVIRSSPALDGTWQRIVWRLDGTALQRGVGAAGIARPLAQPVGSDAVLEGVQGFRVRIWVPDRGWAMPEPGLGNTRATGLELTIDRPYRGRPATFRKVVLLP